MSYVIVIKRRKDTKIKSFLVDINKGLDKKWSQSLTDAAVFVDDYTPKALLRRFEHNNPEVISFTDAIDIDISNRLITHNNLMNHGKT